MNLEKKKELDELKRKMLVDDSLLLKKGATNLVFGDGSPDSEVVFIGEGPGFNEDKQGLPFVGQAGKLLDKGLIAIKLPREEVYITNVVHHRPPGNRDPEPNELAAYGKYLDQIINIIRPKMIVTLGRFSMGKFLPNVKISSVHGKKFVVQFGSQSLIVIPMYHPAAALRNGSIMTEFKKDFMKLPHYLEEIRKLQKTEEKETLEQMELI